MRIVVDAMGSDNFPAPDVEGGIHAARKYGDTIIFVGNQEQIKQELDKHDTTGLDIQIVHTSEYIRQDDSPSQVGRGKPNSSVHIGSAMITRSEADGFVTAGNTGAVMGITMLHTIKRIPGVKRPMLGTFLPLLNYPLLADMGANADCRAEWLAQFALMGSIYTHRIKNMDAPRIGLVSNGEETSKGTQIVREAHELIHELDVNFIGNVEPKDIVNGAADMAVSDGFTGNIIIKTMEATSQFVGQLIRKNMMDSLQTKVGGALAKPAFSKVRQQIDPFEIGGTPLLGINGVVVIGHGRSNALGIENCIRQAREAVQHEVVQGFRDVFQK